MKTTLLTFLTLVLTLNTSAQIITTVAGNGTAAYSGDGGQATVAELNGPSDIAFDAFGNMYIADQSNNRIRLISPSGIITTKAGSGSSGYSGDGGQASIAKLYSPSAIAFDALGNLYIADEINYRIRQVNTLGVISTFAGNGSSGYYGNYVSAIYANLWSPMGVCFDTKGNLYITDALSQRIRKVNTGDTINNIAGNGYGAGGSGAFSGDGGGALGAELNQPRCVAIDAANNIYIADTYNNVIRKVTTTYIITTIAGNNSLGAGYSGDGGFATTAALNNPYGVAIDNMGNLYIADNGNNRIRFVNTSGIISTIVGNGTAGYSGDGGLATAAEINGPTNIAFDASGNLYIADNGNNRIRMVCNNSCGATTGIEQVVNSNEQVNIYPNPNNGSFVIEPNSATKQTMQVYDVTGKLVLSQIINGKTSIDASILNEGIYNISLQSNEGITNKKLVIVR
jgi:sugar lactone lactonase YvrE